MLAVVQHQQGRAGGEHGRNGDGDVTSTRSVPDRARRPMLAHTEGHRDLAGHVVGGDDAGERHDGDRRHLGAAVDDVGEPGLAEAARPDDRGHLGGTQQRLHRGDIVVPAEQRVGLVRDPVPDHWHPALEQPPMLGGVGGSSGREGPVVPGEPASRRRSADRRRGQRVS
ncbi:hypothetical protein [Micromonospora sp. WMMD737]|uniref:hypothetical protein n=1 Tax=Micromonospora sp. WMMD737 TaxID=3404113 RepID=UPI003B9567DC